MYSDRCNIKHESKAPGQYKGDIFLRSPVIFTERGVEICCR